LYPERGAVEWWIILVASMERAKIDQLLQKVPFQAEGLADYDVIEVAALLTDERLAHTCLYLRILSPTQIENPLQLTLCWPNSDFS
jgi:hypothetical protein